MSFSILVSKKLLLLENMNLVDVSRIWSILVIYQTWNILVLVGVDLLLLWYLGQMVRYGDILIWDNHWCLMLLLVRNLVLNLILIIHIEKQILHRLHLFLHVFHLHSVFHILMYQLVPHFRDSFLSRIRYVLSCHLNMSIQIRTDAAAASSDWSGVIRLVIFLVGDGNVRWLLRPRFCNIFLIFKLPFIIPNEFPISK
jgi:hypothetical protein